MKLMPAGLFARTAVLIAVSLMVFSLIAWQAFAWTIVMPAAELTTQLLTQRAQAAIEAARSTQNLPEGAHFAGQAPEFTPRALRGFALGSYVEEVKRGMKRSLHATDVRFNRLAGPSEIWLQLPPPDARWLVLQWRLASPQLPLAAFAVLLGAASLVLGAAAWSARRLSAPLAALANAAQRIAEGDKVQIDTRAGPLEVRTLATAFESMSNRLGELDAQREIVLGGISHDLRTPLARIRVAVDLLQTADASLAGEMIASIEEIDRLADQFLRYARAGYGETPSRAAPALVIEQALAGFRGDARVICSIQDMPERYLMAQCMRHTLQNLVHNALEYGAAPVTVGARLEGQELLLQVHDCGAGLSPEQWNEALQPFKRLHDSATGTHSGLGLALVERLVRMAGGQLEARRDGDGFMVSVRLPAPASTPADRSLS